MKQKYLFLDFDGVLHGFKKGSKEFEKNGLIEELILKLKQKEICLNIIFSTDWQFAFNLNEMKENFFPKSIYPNLNNNIIDGTIYFSLKENLPNLNFETRYFIINNYIEKHNLNIKDCVILDDNETLFPEIFDISIESLNKDRKDFLNSLILTNKDFGIRESDINNIMKIVVD